MLTHLLSISSLIVLVQCTCYSYYKGDTYFSDPNILNNSYCASIITWPISDATINNYQAYDQQAQNLYHQLLAKYQSKSDTIDVDCLGIARFTFCAHAFPTCTPDSADGTSTPGDQQIMCSWLCNLWTVRCPTQTDLYNQICPVSTEGVCSYGGMPLKAWLVLLCLILILIL